MVYKMMELSIQRAAMKDLANLKFNYWKKKLRGKSHSRLRIQNTGGNEQSGECYRKLRRRLRTSLCNMRCVTCWTSACLLAMMTTCIVLYFMAPREPGVLNSRTPLLRYKTGPEGTPDYDYIYGYRLKTPEPVRQFCGMKFREQHDIMSMPPIPRMKRYKNPCFMSKKHGFVCFPYFFLVGMPKSGTSDIYEKLLFHPEFVSGMEKEPHFMRRRFYANESLMNYMKFVYGEAAQKIRKGVGLRGRSTDIYPVITGDLSQTTMHDNDYWSILPGNDPAAGEPRYTSADYIRHLFPDAKIIIQIRNPIDRLWSGYLDFSVAKKTPKEFHSIVMKAIGIYTECFKNRTVRSCIYDRLTYLKVNLEPNESLFAADGICKRKTPATLNLHFGLYYIYIKDFLKAFPKDQVFIQRLEDHQVDEVESMLKIFDFLEMSKPYPTIVNKIRQAGVFNRRYYWDRMSGDILPETRRALYKFYKPFNEKLAELMNDEKYNYGIQ